MPLLSNVPCNLIAKQIIETLEQDAGDRGEAEEEEEVLQVVGDMRGCVQYTVSLQAWNIPDFPLSFLPFHAQKHKHTQTHPHPHTIMSRLIVSHISLYLLH